MSQPATQTVNQPVQRTCPPGLPTVRGKRQGFPSYTERTELNEVLRASSGSGRLKPTYEIESGIMRVAPWQLVLAFLLDLGSGSSETPKGGHPADEPWKTTSGRS